MSKKQKNRKLVLQNLRNRMVNRRYSSTIKTLSKLLKIKTAACENLENFEINSPLKVEASLLLKRYYSILDKAVKKNVIHKNKAARKKSIFSKILSKI